MKIQVNKKFAKSYLKLNKKLQNRVDYVIEVFKQNPFDFRLNNHGLKGDFSGYRSISVGGDLRIIFRENDGYEFVLLFDLGTHSQIYG